MLGTEPEIVRNYVEPGLVRLVFWPILDHGDNSLNAHAAADCIGRQDPDAFWLAHDQFFADQSDLWGADRSYFAEAAERVGVDRATFEACYDSGEGHAVVRELDRIRRERGIFSRPSFDINGQLLVGAQPYELFVRYFEAVSP